EEDQFRATISSALRMMGADPLKALASKNGPAGLESFQFPALDRRQGADSSWADTMDTLRETKKKDQSFWEWRREAPIRPVVFQDTGTLDDDLVQLHLEHRVVKRLLGRFMAQGFVRNDLSRACLTQTTDAIPRVALLGRLVLYGNGATRLHEEIIPVTARWTEPSRRRSALTPYAKEAETKTLDLVEHALLSKRGRAISETVVQQLQSAASRDVTELLPHLEVRGQELGQIATRQLGQRGEREAKQMTEILQDQKKRIASTVQRYQNPQLTLDLDVAETRQLQSNRRHWEKRLASIDAELATEPER